METAYETKSMYLIETAYEAKSMYLIETAYDLQFYRMEAKRSMSMLLDVQLQHVRFRFSMLDVQLLFQIICKITTVI
jgi:hypothetical protein